jgi:hypothetical protein
MKYMLDANTLLFSAVKSGQTDIFVYKIDKGTVEQVTNDVYDDLDASFVAFQIKQGSSSPATGHRALLQVLMIHCRTIVTIFSWLTTGINLNSNRSLN